MSDFGKEVAKEYRQIKDKFAEKTIRPRDQSYADDNTVDHAVAEQIRSDIDHLIEKNENE
jgi:hypothetical protein